MAKLIGMLAYEGSCPRPGHALTPKYITIHNTANRGNGADAVAHGNLLRGGWRNKAIGWHYVVDEGRVVQCIPEDESTWHAGDGANGTGNRQSLAIEICENDDGDLRQATENAAQLTAELMRRHGIPIERVVQHNHWSGKDCPNRIRRGEPYDWRAFLARVQSYLGGGQEAPAPSPAEGTLSVAPGTWNARTGPGMEYPSAKVITGSQVLAYTEMSDGWYHIDGGWIGPKAVANASAAPVPERKTITIKSGTWNLRAGPGMEYGVIKVTVGGRAVNYTEVVDGWYHTAEGWLGPKGVVGAAAQAKTVRVNSGNWRVRQGPGTEYGTVRVMTGGCTVEYTEITDGWYHIADGWIGPACVR